ncbi:MAG: sensor histidine kinase [Rhodoglobus sp.]
MNLSRLTIRARITGGSLLIAILISVIAGVIIFAQVQRIVTDGQQRVLDNVEAPYLVALAEDAAEEVDPPGADQLVAIVAPDGEIRLNTLPSSLSGMLPNVLDRPNETWPIAIGSASFLVRSSAVDNASGSFTVVSATRNDAEATVLNQVALLLIASIAGINIAFGAASWFIGSAALGPVGRLRRSAAELVRSRNDELLPVGPARDEIAELAHALNELIVQLRASAERERNIVSDASHEFRTPLAIIQTQLELAQRDAHSVPQMQEDVAAAQRSVARLTALATSMLELSRIDAQAVAESTTVDALIDELADAADRARIRVAGREVIVDYEVGEFEQGSALAVAVSAADFGRVCDNLVSNSLAAMGESGLIEMTLIVETDQVVLRVTDTAGGMDETFVPHAFDRFSRAEQARTGSGAGLGLSIVAGIVAVSGGEIRLDNQPGVGLTVEIALPIQSAKLARSA